MVDYKNRNSSHNDTNRNIPDLTAKSEFIIPTDSNLYIYYIDYKAYKQLELC